MYFGNQASPNGVLLRLSDSEQQFHFRAADNSMALRVFNSGFVSANSGGSFSGNVTANGFITNSIGPNANSIISNISEGALFAQVNGTGSVNFPTTFGQSFGVRGDTDQRSFFFYKPNGDNNTLYFSDYTGSEWRHQQIWHSNNSRSDSQNDNRYALQSTAINAGTGLTGGGDLSSNRTINVNFGTSAGTVAQGNDSRINNGQTAYGWGNHASAGYVPNSRTINIGGVFKDLSANRGWSLSEIGATPNTRTISTGSGLSGGGNLTANRTISVNFGTTAGTVAQGNHTHPASDITSGTFANSRISQSSVTQHEAAINAGRVDGKHIWAGTEDNLPSSRNSNTIYFAY